MTALAICSPPHAQRARNGSWLGAWPGEGRAAKNYLERSVLDDGGVVLQYGRFYRPGTFHQDEPPSPPRIHIAEAARRTAAALDATSGLLVITDE